MPAVDREFFASYGVLPRPFVHGAVGVFYGAFAKLAGQRVRVEGEVPRGAPVLLATNSTQKYDFMPIRVHLRALGVPAVTVTKAKNYSDPVSRFLLSRLGVVPVSSRGYLLVADFLAVHGRRPSEEEYRALRNHLDRGEPLPSSGAFRALAETPREMIGFPYSPSGESLRDAYARVHAATMAETLRLSREAASAGFHVQMYPEGTVSRSLGEGRSGAVQLAHALSLPIVPVAMNGCAEAFAGKSPRPTKGEIVLRFGEPYRLDGSALPSSFRAFHPEDERLHSVALKALTGTLMTRLNDLLDPPYRRGAQVTTDGSVGTARFV